MGAAVLVLTDTSVPSLPKGWNAAVEIFEADGTTVATVYKDDNGDATGTNPLPKSKDGNFGRNYDGSGGWKCWVAAGDYVVSVTPHGGSEHHTTVTVAAPTPYAPPQDDLLPATTVDDAGKVLTVNEAGTGYELDAPGGGSGTWGAASTAQFSFAGDPNGNVTALAEGDLCVDTTTPALYQAPGAGTVWTLITPPIIVGQGSPIGVVTPPTVGAIYLDIEFGVAYFAAAATSADWFSFAGAADATTSGVYSYDGEVRLQDGTGGFIDISSGTAMTITPDVGNPVSIANSDGDQGGMIVDSDGTNTRIGLYTASQVVQPAAIVAPSGGSTVDTEARAAITAILNALGAAAGGIGITA